jgi:hypothetical protein
MYTLVTNHSNTYIVFIFRYLLFLTIQFNIDNNININNIDEYIFLSKSELRINVKYGFMLMRSHNIKNLSLLFYVCLKIT